MLIATLLTEPLFYPIAIVVSAVGWVVYQRVYSPYAGIPGPFWASITRLWYLNRINDQEDLMHQHTKKLHKIYGPLVRIAPNEVSVSDPAAMKQIYAVNAGYTKTDFYPTQAPNLSPHGDSFTELNEKRHSFRRRMISHIFSMSSVVESESFIDNATKAYFNVIDEYATKGKPMEMGHWLHMYTFDIIGELFFGRMFGFINERRDIGGYMAAVDVILPHAIRLAVLYEWMRPIINIVMYPLSANLRQAIKCFEALGAESKRYVDERVGVKTTRPDMLAKLLKVAEEKSPDFDITDVYTESYTAIFAGSETTATAMRSCVYHLCRNPEAKAKLVKEIDEAQREGKLSDIITYGEAIKLPYLSAVIKEAMRVQPSIVLTFPRHVPAGGATICGRYFPEGCRVGVNPYVLHYQTSIFGDDAEDFNPDRWFRPEASNMESYLFQFGSGARTCIGKNVAMAEIYKFIPKLFREYDVRLENPNKPWKEEGAWFVKQTGVEVIFTRRNAE